MLRINLILSSFISIERRIGYLNNGRVCLSLIISILLLPILSYAQQNGCQQGNQVFQLNIVTWFTPIQSNCPQGSTTSTQYAQVISSTNTICYIGAFGAGGTGRIVSYRIALCPIDDYIPFLILAAGGFGFFYLRKKNKLFPLNR
ncbi:hypothetical protein [Pedobacter frigiditerrae]|uniref:hypothetical protein n=1 Tax=Pedobacter frigiditerrae TaxID=2530452 RepID=UPI0029305F90|nr:hypothetical protein [Pedobacter frigiditerrae]